MTYDINGHITMELKEYNSNQQNQYSYERKEIMVKILQRGQKIELLTIKYRVQSVPKVTPPWLTQIHLSTSPWYFALPHLHTLPNGIYCWLVSRCVGCSIQKPSRVCHSAHMYLLQRHLFVKILLDEVQVDHDSSSSSTTASQKQICAVFKTQRNQVSNNLEDYR